MGEAPIPSSHSGEESLAAANTDEADVILHLPNNISVRRSRLSDAPSYARHANSRNVWNNLRNRLPHPYTEEDARWWINHNQDPANHVRSGSWTPESGAPGPLIPTRYAITINDTAIGSIGLEFNAPEEVYARTAEVGYWIGEEFWGRGLMSTVLPAFVAWAWKTFGILVRLEAGIFDRNVGSRRCLEKAGFEFEGVRRCKYVKNGVVGDEVMLGAVRPGFEKA